jgi:hypothetical protein
VEEVRSGGPGKQRARAACLDRRQVARFEARSGMPYAENTAMNGNEGAGGKARPNLAIGDADPLELSSAHHSVGPTRQLRDFSLDRADLWSHTDH